MPEPRLPGIPHPAPSLDSLMETTMALKNAVEILMGVYGDGSRSAKYSELQSLSQRLDDSLVGVAAARATLEIETGTFTPTMAFATPGTSSFTYTQQEGRYLKVSQWYIIQLVLQVTPTIGTGSGEIRIGGLPAAAAINSQPGVFGVFGGSLLTWPASRTQLVPLFRLGQTYMVMEAHGSAVGGSIVTAANLTGGSNTLIRLSGVFDT